VLTQGAKNAKKKWNCFPPSQAENNKTKPYGSKNSQISCSYIISLCRIMPEGLMVFRIFIFQKILKKYSLSLRSCALSERSESRRSGIYVLLRRMAVKKNLFRGGLYCP
jgi:hypothetical protein